MATKSTWSAWQEHRTRENTAHNLANEIKVWCISCKIILRPLDFWLENTLFHSRDVIILSPVERSQQLYQKIVLVFGALCRVSAKRVLNSAETLAPSAHVLSLLLLFVFCYCYLHMKSIYWHHVSVCVCKWLSVKTQNWYLLVEGAAFTLPVCWNDHDQMVRTIKAVTSGSRWGFCELYAPLCSLGCLG